MSYMEPSSAVAESSAQQQSQQSAAPSGGPQIRSRITVVCAECKRLKLKCDRRNPCGSCTKRDTIARCIYSPAAAEKVDLHSLNNRLIQVESQLAQLSAPGARPHNSHNAGPPSIHNDRALLAVGQSGSSLAISLEDVSAIWLDELDLNKDMLTNQNVHQSQSSNSTYATSAHIKLEPMPVSLPSSDVSSTLELPLPLLMPPMTVYYSSASPTPSEAASVTPRLVSLLSFSPRKRQKLYDITEDVLKMRPCFNWKHFKDRAEGVFKWASEMEIAEGALHESSSGYPGNSRASSTSGPASKAETARAIFFGPPPDPPPTPRGPVYPKPTISFFAAVAAAFALGTLLDKEATDERSDARFGSNGQDDNMSVDDGSSSGRSHFRRKIEQFASSARKPKGTVKSIDITSSPAALFILSQQASDIFKASNNYDLDFLIASILQVLFLLHDGKPSLSHVIPPLVAQMVSIARTMGLNSDPDEFPGKYNLFEAETRRRVWWDIFYYDLFVADCMGQLPFIVDNSFTTKMPLDVDEDLFSPASTSVPLPRSSLSPLDHESTDFKYFGLKCHLAKIIKNVKKRPFKDPVRDTSSHDQPSIEQVATLESEVKQWLTELPPGFRLDMNAEFPSTIGSQFTDHLNGSPSSLFPGDLASGSPILIAQRCELAITANRLILKAYLPFLRSSYVSSTASYYQAVMSTINAAHVIIYASRVLFFTWKQQADQRHRRPIPGVFGFYSFGRTLFDAAVICAHGVIKQPTSVWARPAFEDVNAALEVMRDTLVVTGRGSMRGGVEGNVSEAVKIVEIMKKRADAARTGGNDPCAAGMKRKHDEVDMDAEQLLTDFQFPYVGAAVTSARSPCPSDAPATALPPASATASIGHLDQIPESCVKDIPKRSATSVVSSGDYRRGSTASSECSKTKDKHKKAPYPTVGIRVRPGKEPSPLTRQRVTPTSASSDFNIEPEPRMQAPSLVSFAPPPSQTSSHAPTPVPENASYHHQPSSNQDSSPFCPPSSSDVRMPPPLSQEPPNGANIDYSLPFGGAEHGQMSVDMLNRRKFSINEHGQNGRSSQKFSAVTPPQPASMFDPTHAPNFGSSSPASYNGGPGTSSSGQLSNANSPYGGSGGPSYVPNISAPDPRSTPYREPLPNPPQQSYYSYDSTYERSMNPQNLTLGPMNMNSAVSMDTNGDGRGNPGGPGNMHTDPPRDAMYTYSSEKPHMTMFGVEPPDHSRTPHQPFPEESPPSMTQVWAQDPSNGQNGTEFWQFYRS